MGRGSVTAYPRQLESLIRLSEAHARMRLSNVVEELDVEEATRLHKEALKQAATDPKTGKFFGCTLSLFIFPAVIYILKLSSRCDIQGIHYTVAVH